MLLEETGLGVAARRLLGERELIAERLLTKRQLLQAHSRAVDQALDLVEFGVGSVVEQSRSAALVQPVNLGAHRLAIAIELCERFSDRRGLDAVAVQPGHQFVEHLWPPWDEEWRAGIFCAISCGNCFVALEHARRDRSRRNAVRAARRSLRPGAEECRGRAWLARGLDRA